MKLTLADVALEARTGGAEAIYTYRLDFKAAPGDALIVPLGSRTVLGYAIRVYEAAEADLAFPVASLRPAKERIIGFSVPEQILALVRHTADQTITTIPVAISPAMPVGVRTRLTETLTLAPGGTPNDLPVLQREVIELIAKQGGSILSKTLKELPPPLAKALGQLRKDGHVVQGLSLPPLRELKKNKLLYRLTGDSARIEQFLHEEGKRKPAQALTLIRMQSIESTAISNSEIRALSGVTDAIVQQLFRDGLLEAVKPEERKVPEPPTPNEEQQAAINSVVNDLKTGASQGSLLFGVTGSGKTEVYLRCAAEALKLGRQVLYLVPEIALAAQVIAQLRDRFGDRVAVVHSELTPTERLANWMRIRSGEAPVVLGARSALFAPLTNIGLIIVDEEHEGSYKQDNSPRYHAKRLARFLANQHQCPFILGSATPSLESYYEAETGSELKLLTLQKRAAHAQLPEVFIEDLGAGYRKGHPAILGPQLKDRLTDVLEREEQAILFLNRRAYAPMLMCRDCGQTFACPRCSVSLSYSRRDKKLRCHHCDHVEQPPEECPKCGGVRISPFGVGTEKVEETVKQEFPQARVARLDRDVASRRGALEEILAQFRAGDLNVLVGTQIVAKGLDFPKVTLVGVIAADTGLGIPDFRAAERTFQVLSQVSGRAGRSNRPGHVVIQTFNPLHSAITCAQDHDYLAFYRGTLIERQQANYPPFCRLINIVLSGENYPTVRHASFDLAVSIEGMPGVEVLGPVDAPLERIQNQWRRHMILKVPNEFGFGPLRKKIEAFKPKNVHVSVDVDAYSLS
ncbi:MAG: primosomal protein N' [Fimbriimonadaceae bacterium]